MFKKLNKADGDDVCVLCSKGKYTVHELYTWKKGLYAQVGSSYVRLREDMMTSSGAVISHIETDVHLGRDRFGRLCVVHTKREAKFLVVETEDGHSELRDVKNI